MEKMIRTGTSRMDDPPAPGPASAPASEAAKIRSLQ